MLARDGQIVLVTTCDPQLYCPESPIAVVNVESEKLKQARQRQRETGRPLFITLSEEGLILREPAAELMQHYGRKLFAQLWCAPRVRFIFEQTAELSDFRTKFRPRMTWTTGCWERCASSSITSWEARPITILHPFPPIRATDSIVCNACA